MNLIFNNPYRILGLPITAGEREIAKQINTLATYAEMGKTKSLDTDFSFLPSIERTPQTIEEAKKQIEQSENKFLYSLFWFWKNNSVDELALDVLKEGNITKAISIWEKSIFAKKQKVYKSVVLIDDLIKQSDNVNITINFKPIKQSDSWAEYDDDDHNLKKEDDKYIIERKKETDYSIPCVFTDLNYEDNWTIECNTEWLSGVGNIGYGIVFGRDKGSFFTFQISGNGQCTYGKFIDWDYTLLMKWKEEAVINKWGTNHISIEKINDTLNFSINGQLVHSNNYEPFFGKYFGFKVTNNQKIAFSNFKFCKLVEDDTYGEGINISSKNFSCLKNLSTLYLSLAANNGSFQYDYFIKGITLAKTFFTAENIEDYSKLIAGEQRCLYNSEKTFHFYINEIIDSFKKHIGKKDGISISQLINTFSSFPVEAKQYLNNKYVGKQIQNIDKEIEISNKERKRSPITAAEIGKKLVSNTKADIIYLKNILGISYIQYQIIADKLSYAIVQCGIDFYNVTNNDEIYINEYEFAYSIAVSDRIKDRAKENLDSCKLYIDNKIYFNCWFCGSKTPEESSNLEVTIYKENNRSYFPRKVQFSYVPVNIPRCKDCQKIHNQSSNMLVFPIIGFAIAGLIIGIIADGYWFAGLLIGGVVGWIIGASIKGQKISKEDIKDTSYSTIKYYPPLEKKLKEGWQFSKPTA